MGAGEELNRDERRSAFGYTEASLQPVLEELRTMEPLFHVPGFGRSVAEFGEVMAEDYWEVGASGKRYSRAFILWQMRDQPVRFAEELGWKTSDWAVRQLGSVTFLVTYGLEQGMRRTRRASLWRRDADRWRVLYHQGTVIAAEDDELAPEKDEGAVIQVRQEPVQGCVKTGTGLCENGN